MKKETWRKVERFKMFNIDLFEKELNFIQDEKIKNITKDLEIVKGNKFYKYVLKDSE